MSEQSIRLARAWGRHPAGTVLRILAPGEQITTGSVDPARAATLLGCGLADLGGKKNTRPDDPEPSATPPKASKRASKKGEV